MYAGFTVDGTQGSPGEDFRRASQNTQQPWLRSYGKGGGAKVSVVGLIDIDSGDLLKSVFISAVLKSGKSNTLAITNMRTNSKNNLEIAASSFFSPRGICGEALPRQTNNRQAWGRVFDL